MSFWDNVKKFAQPYADDDYDDYDEKKGLQMRFCCVIITPA